MGLKPATHVNEDAFFIAVQIAQVTQQIWIALAGQLRQSGQQYGNAG